jgi:hypothetical protein
MLFVRRVLRAAPVTTVSAISMAVLFAGDWLSSHGLLSLEGVPRLVLAPFALVAWLLILPAYALLMVSALWRNTSDVSPSLIWTVTMLLPPLADLALWSLRRTALESHGQPPPGSV